MDFLFILRCLILQEMVSDVKGDKGKKTAKITFAGECVDVMSKKGYFKNNKIISFPLFKLLGGCYQEFSSILLPLLRNTLFCVEKMEKLFSVDSPYFEYLNNIKKEIEVLAESSEKTSRLERWKLIFSIKFLRKLKKSKGVFS